MKKIVSAILCIVLALFTLAGCGKDVIGDYIDQYEKPTEKPALTLNLYIICGDETVSNAKVTVAERIKTYTLDTYETTLNVVYCDADEYAAKIQAATKNDATEKADIFLITSEEMMNTMVENEAVADLTELMQSKSFGKLNAQIATSLLDAAKIDNKFYCVPNNFVVGEYEYLSINKEIARNYYFSDDILKTYTDYDEFMTDNLWVVLSKDALNPADYIKDYQNSQLDENLISNAYEYKKLGTEGNKYLLVEKAFATKYGVDLSEIDGLAAAKEKDYWQQAIDNKETPGLYILEKTFNSELSDDDKAMLASSEYYCNKVAKDADGTDYILFNKEKAEENGFDSNDDFKSYTSYEKISSLNLRQTMELAGVDPSTCIKVVKGMYEDKARLESEGNICNVISYPKATSADAFSSAFAISSTTPDLERAMELLYALNTDTVLRNYLQYGIEKTNYTVVDGKVVRVVDEDNAYFMNPLYTGDIFKMLYSEELGWLESNAENGVKQNKESTFGGE